MNINKILQGIDNLKVKGNLDLDIKGIENYSENVKEGYLFIAIEGFSTDGHKYVNNAIEKGAKAVIIQENCDKNLFDIPEDVTVIMIENTRKALAICSDNFFNHPSQKFKLIGITGTKGKTTTSYMIKQILEKAGKKVGLIGTIACYSNGRKIEESDRTTPESLHIQELFNKMVEDKVEYVVMEVSSQSLKLNRVDKCNFDMVIFTNLSEDHISEKEHANMKEYFETKLKLFEMCKVGFVNSDDLYTTKIPKLFPQSDITTFGIDNFANLLAKDITITNTYVDFKVKLGDRNERVKTGIPGRFSVYNSLAAICIAQKIGISKEIIKEALLEVRVPGRSEMIDNKREIPIMIDYAHTSESLENILRAVKSYTKGKVICVFGCGGNRDKQKRPIMGEISGRIADETIITSDNPRDEKPEEIISEIENGIKKTKGKYKIIVDRTKAIKSAIKRATKNDIIVLAGKGHETYQEIKGKKYPYDERKVIKEIFEELEKNDRNKKDKKGE